MFYSPPNVPSVIYSKIILFRKTLMRNDIAVSNAAIIVVLPHPSFSIQ